MNNLQHDSYTSQYDELFGRAGFSTTHRYLLDQISPASKILELGPASGYMTKILAGRNCIIDAIELNPHDAEKAAQYCRKLVVGSLEDPEVFAELPGPYEVVLMADVLEHLRSPEVVLRAVRPRLSAGGMALVSLPNIAYWQMRLALLQGRFEYTDTGLLDRTHVRFFTLKTAREMFTQTGFRVVHVAVTPPTIPRLGKLKERVKRAWPTLFSINFIFHLRRDDT